MTFVNRILRSLLFAANAGSRKLQWITVCTLLAAPGLAQFNQPQSRHAQAQQSGDGTICPAVFRLADADQLSGSAGDGCWQGAGDDHSGRRKVAAASPQFEMVAPGLFSANVRGQGLVIGVALRVKADGSQSFEPIVRFDEDQQQFAAVPINLVSATDNVFLVLFGMGPAQSKLARCDQREDWWSERGRALCRTARIVRRIGPAQCVAATQSGKARRSRSERAG